MIELIPAIDIIEGKCVRLTKGDYDTKKVYGDPLAMAQQFEDLGMRRLHVVDLDGAKSQHVVNLDALKAITTHTSLRVDFGGGVKSDDDLERAFDAGASMVTAGSIAITDPDRYLGWLERAGRKIPTSCLRISSLATCRQARRTCSVRRLAETERLPDQPSNSIKA